MPTFLAYTEARRSPTLSLATSIRKQDFEYQLINDHMSNGHFFSSGRLPFAYPTATGQLAYQYGSYAHDVQWPFGFGLSYTTFTYSNLRIPDAANVNATMQIAVDVTNTGSVAGKDTLFVYVSELFAYPDKQYIDMVHGFKKIALNSGETATVVFTLGNEDFAQVGYDGQDIVVNVRVNDQKGSFTLTPRSVDGTGKVFEVKVTNSQY